MGLRMEELEVVSHLPSLVEIQTSLGELASDIVFDGSLDLTSEDQARLETHKPRKGFFPFRSNHVRCCFRHEVLKKKRGITYVDILATLSGDRSFLTGNNHRLMDALMEGLISSGYARRTLP